MADAPAGIRVFATDGLGGVHRGANKMFDESADLVTLVRVPLTAASAGDESILDIRATLEPRRPSASRCWATAP